MKKIAIYEPDPRICGPDTWAQNLRWGFRELGHDCDVVTFTKSGKRRDKWGRVTPELSSSNMCEIEPDVCAPRWQAGAVLDEYDLVVLTDVKCAPADKEANGEWPCYLDALGSTTTPFTSALHGRWYYSDVDELPEGCSAAQGSPFIEELLSLKNFSGFLLEHANDFDKYSRSLQSVRGRALLPLPYRLRYSDEEIEAAVANRHDDSIAVIGRVVPIKYRHLVSATVAEFFEKLHVTYAGSCAATYGPSGSLVLYEQLLTLGFEGEREGGVRRTVPWHARRGGLDFEYTGAYVEPLDALRAAQVHVGITDCDFSGGLLEFSTLEAIDCGCVPMITRAFVPHGGTDVDLVILDRRYSRQGPKWVRDNPDELSHVACAIRAALRVANGSESLSYVTGNRAAIRRENDPRLHAETYIKRCLT